MSHNETPRQDEDGRLCQGEDHGAEESEATLRLNKTRYGRFLRRTNKAPNKARAVEVGSGTGSELKTQI